SDIGRMPIGEMVRASEIVVIATTLSVHSVSDDDEYAILSVDRVWRGPRVPGTIRLTTKSIVAGANLPCCTVGTRLLVFATNDYSNRYSATNDYHGVFVLDGRRVLYWPELKDDTWGDIDAVLHE